MWNLSIQNLASHYQDKFQLQLRYPAFHSLVLLAIKTFINNTPSIKTPASKAHIVFYFIHTETAVVNGGRQTTLRTIPRVITLP